MADLTRLVTGEGVLWLASVRDAFANRIVGWATDPRATTTLVLTALNHALRSRDVRPRQSIFHSDKGAQYLAENLLSTIKVELLYWPGTTFAALLRYIDGWYSPHRTQSGLGGLSPHEYEDAHHRAQRDDPDR